MAAAALAKWYTRERGAGPSLVPPPRKQTAETLLRAIRAATEDDVVHERPPGGEDKRRERRHPGGRGYGVGCSVGPVGAVRYGGRTTWSLRPQLYYPST